MLPTLLSLLAVLHTVSSRVIINELNADNPRADDMEYIELYNTENYPVNLNRHVVVLYNGADDTAYDVIYLWGNTIPPRGYFVIGSSNVVPAPDFVLPQNSNSFQNGPDGVALYFANPNDFNVGMSVTASGLEDAIVYSRYTNRPADGLTSVLTPGHGVVHEDENFNGLDESLSRCSGTDPLNTSQFQVSYATPGGQNNCSLTQGATVTPPPTLVTFPPPTPAPGSNVVINEVNSDNPGTDDQEYVELLNTGSTPANLNGFVLVYYNGADDTAYTVIDLSGGTIPSNGYFTIGSSNVVPVPDVVSDNQIQNGPDAVALYYGNAADYFVGMTASRANLVDAVLYTNRQGVTAASLVATLAPGQELVYENAGAIAEDESISRCGGLHGVTLSEFQVTLSTPGGENNCAPLPTASPTTPTVVPEIIINELNSDTPGADTEEFIELYNKGSSNVDLSDYQLVFYNGDDSQAYLIIQLTGSILANSYYTVGSVNVQPRPNLVFDNSVHVIQNGLDAVALHYQRSDIVVGSMVNAVGLVDALVHTKYTPPTESGLINVLTPGQQPALEISSISADDISLGRCSGNDALTLAQFRLTVPTPGAPNNCNPLVTLPPPTTTQLPPVSQVIINEMNADSPSVDDFEYIELYNKENRDVSLNNFVLVLYNGNTNTAYRVLPFNGLTIPRQGYFVIGTSNTNPGYEMPNNFLQNGPDAIALYYGDVSMYSPGMDVTRIGLVDVVVYINSGGDSASGLTSALTPGQPPLHEDSRVLEQDESIGRCTGNDPVSLSQFRVMLSTPGQPNDCSPLPTSAPNPAPAIVINELNADNPSIDDEEYIELYNTESVTVRLDNVVLVFYNGHSNTAYNIIDLSGNSIPAEGYFVVGSPNVSPSPDVVLQDSLNILQNGVDAVGLYFGSPSQFVWGMEATSVNLIDAIVYSSVATDTNAQLTSTLTPGEAVLHENANQLNSDEGLSRCGGFTPFQLSQYRISPRSPGRSNLCSPPSIVLNEVNADNPGFDDQEFIELYNGGGRARPLDRYVIVLYDGRSSPRAYDVIPLAGYSIGSQGYFVIGSENVSPRPDLVLQNGIHVLEDGPDAVALYNTDFPERFTIGMAPTDSFLVDVLIYTKYQGSSNVLIDLLAPGQQIVMESSSSSDVSISRCDGSDFLTLSQFRSTYLTPGGPNNCAPLTTILPPVTGTTGPTLAPPSTVIVNEINADNPGRDDQEFVELYNTANSPVSLDNYVLVLYNGATDTAYEVIYLSGKNIRARGYFVIGSDNVSPTPDFALPQQSNDLQNGPDGVALYNGNPSDYSVGMSVTTNGLVDAIVYSRYTYRPADGLTSVLTPGHGIVHEDDNFDVIDESLSRCSGTDPLNTSQFQVSYATPGGQNNCSLAPGATVTPPTTVVATTQGGITNPIPNIVISELNADNPGADDEEYLELRNKDPVTVSLTNFVVVFYNGATNTAYYVVDLSSYSIPARGFFTIGSANVNPRPDIVVSSLSIQNGPDAVALYYGDRSSFTVGMIVTSANLRDVLIYSKRTGDTIAGISDVLAPGQQLVIENEQALAEDESISRCGGFDANSLFQFRVTFATPGGENNCADLPTLSPPVTGATSPQTTPPPSGTAPNVVINEVNSDNPGTDDQEYVELRNKGSTAANLNGVILVYYNGADDRAYAVIDLSGATIPSNGYFTIGSSNVVPYPDVVSESMIQNGPDAVALYYGNAADYFVGMTASRANLVDAVLYTNRLGVTAASLVATLAPGQELVYENAAAIAEDESISRCGGLHGVTLSEFQVTRPTPGGENNCAPLPTASPTTPTVVPDVIINELNSDTPGVDTEEFIELYNKGSSNVDLSDFQLVLYNGADNQAYMVIQLTGFILARSYYTIGSVNVQPRPRLVFDSADNVIHNGLDAVALHYQRSDIVVGSMVNAFGLVDALVHTKYTPPTGSELINVLTPGQQPALELIYISAGDNTLGRCSGNDALTLAQFRLTVPTPGAPNNCNPLATLPPVVTTVRPPVAQVIINEMNADSPSIDDHEYIELYNKENRDVSLNNFVLVLYNGNTNKAYRVLSFNGLGLTIPRRGYFVIGTRNTNPGYEMQNNFIQNGPDAIALYYGDTSGYVSGMDVTTNGLVDVVVYVNSGGDSASGLTSALTPGQPPLHEDSRVLEQDESIGRCTGNDPVSLSQFRVMLSTPGKPNDCSPLPTAAPNPAPAVVINELNSDNPGTDNREYLELYNTESVTVRLDNMVLVFYNGHTNTAYNIIDLSRNSIPAKGYFVVGSPNVRPSPDIVLQNSQNILQNGVDAVGLYFGRPSQFVVGMQVTGVDLIDAIVYSKYPNDTNAQLVNALTPGEVVLHEKDDEFHIDETLSRCGGSTPFRLFQYQITPPSPGRKNRCAPPIIINEVNADNPSTDDEEFIELVNHDDRPHPMDRLVIVLYDGSSSPSAYNVIPLRDFGPLGGNGYFVIGSENVSPRPDLVLPAGQNILQNGPDAVALYHYIDPDIYTIGMEPTAAFLADVLVYSKYKERTTELINILAPGQQIVIESSTVSEVSVSRCDGTDRVTLSQFRSTYHTPGRPNVCTPLPTNSPPTGSTSTVATVGPSGLVINEFNADNPSYDTKEFIELYNPGKNRVSLDGVFLVLFNGATDLAYSVIELAGNEVAPESFFVIGSSNVDPLPNVVLQRNQDILQNGEDGIALYFNPGGRYYGGMPVTAENLLDAVVYSTKYWNGSNLILNTLTPGQQALHEYSRHNPNDDDESLSRCKGMDPVTLSQFILTYPTPGDENNCESLRQAAAYSGLSGGGVAGIVIALLCVLGVAGVAGFLVFRRKTASTEFGLKGEMGMAYNNMGDGDSVKVTGLPAAYDGFDNIMYNIEHGVKMGESDT